MFGLNVRTTTGDAGGQKTLAEVKTRSLTALTLFRMPAREAGRHTDQKFASSTGRSRSDAASSAWARPTGTSVPPVASAVPE